MLLRAILIAIWVTVASSTHGVYNDTSGHVSRQLLGLKPPDISANSIVEKVLKQPSKIPLLFEKWSHPHVPTDQAIFACALSTTYIGKDAVFFAGTARKAGFTGDIVVAVLPNTNQGFLDKLKSYNVSVYLIPIECSGHSDVRCKFKNAADFPVTLLRHYAYQAWAAKYPSNAYIMVSDFRDVLFQSNPFKNKFDDWGPANYDLVVFQEAHPNRVINRCPQTGGFTLGCYGKEAYRRISANTISSSGVVFGTRDAVIVYVRPHLCLLSPHLALRLTPLALSYHHLLPQTQLITEQGDAAVRTKQARDADAAKPLTNKRCWGLGVDQAFHNYLLYTGMLGQYMSLRVFPQGEGPVNNLGGFFGEAKLLRASLEEWRILRGEEGYKYVYNWNGEISSVVHQLDRYL